MSYKNPALIEQFAELFFEHNSLPQDILFEIVPNIKKKGYPTIEIGQAGSLSVDASNHNIIRPVQIPRIRCYNENKSNLIQLSPNFIAVNKIGKYYGWKDYNELFDVAFNAITDSAPKAKVDSAKFNTIDVIKVPIKNFTVGKYLFCGGKIIPSWYNETDTSFDMSLGKGLLQKDRFNRQVQISGRSGGDQFIISIHSVYHEMINGSNVKTLLDKLHEESNESFEAMITDYTRNEIMGGEK
jgi:uncharacterized protein (TIGR04255 family)